MGIPEYFKGKTILITGVTGLMGKALVEKLLRSCPEVAKIYVVIRPKRGATVEERWAQIPALRLFDKLKSEQPRALEKVVPIPGEGAADNYGISPEHEQILLDTVNVIFHVAASVNFNEQLIAAIDSNVKGVFSLLEMAKKMKNLECFVHTSTAYSNFEKYGKVDERIYESSLDWRVMMTLTEDHAKNEKYMSALQPKLMSGHELTYTLTKRMAESMVQDYCEYFPIVVMRPGLVLATVEDPIPAWLDAHNALTGLSEAVRRGYIRTVYADVNSGIPAIPLDLSIKAFLVATWNVHRKNMKKGLDVYCTVLTDVGKDGIPLSWGFIAQGGLAECQDYPSPKQLWHPFLLAATNIHVFRLLYLLLQVIPAILCDLFVIANGKKPVTFKLAMKYYKLAITTLGSITRRRFHFAADNFLSLETILKPEDRKDFSMDQSKLSPERMLEINIHGMTEHILHEDMSPEALKARRQRSKMLKKAHYASCVIGAVIVCFIVLKIVTAFVG